MSAPLIEDDAFVHRCKASSTSCVAHSTAKHFMLRRGMLRQLLCRLCNFDES